MKNLFEKIKGSLKREPSYKEERKGNNPFHDWAILFWGTVGLSCVVLLGGGYVFWATRNGTLFDKPLEDAPVSRKINQEKVSNLLSLFETRTKNFEAKKTDKISVPDPSL